MIDFGRFAQLCGHWARMRWCRDGRRRQDDRTTDRIAMALELIRQTDEHWHGLAVWLLRSGMDRDADLLDRLAARAERRPERR